MAGCRSGLRPAQQRVACPAHARTRDVSRALEPSSTLDHHETLRLIVVLRTTTEWEEDERIQALTALASKEPAPCIAIPYVVEALRGPGRFARYAAHDTVSAYGRPMVSALVAELRKDAERARVAAQALGRFADHSDIVVPALVAALTHEDEHVRSNSVHSLSSFGSLAAPAIPRLILLLEEDYFVARCLSAIGPASVPALIVALDSPRTFDRVYAADALARIGSASRPAVPRLRGLRSDSRPGVRAMALVALGSVLPPEEAVPLLVQALTDEDCNDYLRERAVAALASLGPQASDAAPALRAAIDRGEPWRLEAAQALLAIQGDPTGALQREVDVLEIEKR